MPDYPLWTAAVTLAGGKPRHYLCDEASNWYPDLKDIESKITSKTKAILVINPNNPTGALYPKEILEALFRLQGNISLLFLQMRFTTKWFMTKRNIFRSHPLQTIFFL
jgi:aspartate/methionine/tyrosine aminotransferase